MKKVLCIVLSMIMAFSAFSAIGVTAFAVDETDTESGIENEEYGYTSINFEPDPENESYYKPYRYSNGYWEYVRDEQTDTWSYDFIYDCNDIYLDGNKIILSDAQGNECVYTCVDGAFCNADDEYLDDAVLESDLVTDENGDTFVEIRYDGLVDKYPVEFTQTDIKAVEIKNSPKALAAYTDGSYARLWAGENEGQVAFCYDTLFNEGSGFTVYYTNGEVEEFAYDSEEGTYIDQNGSELDYEAFSYIDSQDYEEWQAGNTYSIACYYKGYSFGMDFAVSANPVKAVNYEQASIPQVKEGWDGDVEYGDCENCEDGCFIYDIGGKFPCAGDKIIVTYSDDSTKEFVLDGYYFTDTEDADNVIPYEIMAIYDNQSTDHWQVGVNTFNLALYGYTAELSAEVLPNEIVSVDFAPVKIIENNGGYWDYDEDENQIYIYNNPHFLYGSRFTITFADGEEVTYYYDKDEDWFCDEEGNLFEQSINTETTQQHEEPWGIGTHTLCVEVGGIETDVTVTVVANPVKAINFVPGTPYVFEFETDGEWSEYYDEETETTEECFIYDTSDCEPYTEGNKLEVAYTNGKTDVFTYSEDAGKFLNAKGQSLSPAYDVELYDVQILLPWSMEEPDYNYLGVTFMGVVGVVRVVLDDGEIPEAATITQAYNGTDSVTLLWENVANAEKFIVYRRKMSESGKAQGNWIVVGETTDCAFEDVTVGNDVGYYIYFVHADNSNGTSAYDAEKALYVKYVPPVKNFKVTSAANGVSIKWDAFDGEIAIYRRAAGEAEWTYLATRNGMKNSVIDPNVQSGKYYKYAAVRVDDEMESVVTESSLLKYIATPDIKTIKNAVSGIYFNWTAVEGATGYRVYRRAAGEKSYKLIATTQNLWYCDQSVKENNGTYYKYTVKAYSGNYMSAYKDGPVLQRLIFPVMTSVANTNDGVLVKWNKLNKATEYRIYRRGAGQNTWTYLGTTKGLQFLDKGVKNASGNYYRYTVRAVFGKTYGGFDTNGLVILRLGTPSLTRAKNVNGGLNVEWSAVKGATGYYVYRKTSKTTWLRIGTTTKTSYVDNTAAAGTEYIYTVKAYKGSYMSGYVSGGIKYAYIPEPAVLTPVNVADGVMVKWYEVPVAERYYVGRRLNNGTWETIKVIYKADIKKDEHGNLYYIDKTAVDGTTYGYSVRAYAKNATSSYTENRFTTYYDPIDVTSAKNTAKGITITWEKSPKADSYLLLRKAEGDNGFMFYKNGLTGTSFTDEDVTAGVKYTYVVWACGGPRGKVGNSVSGASKSCTAK